MKDIDLIQVLPTEERTSAIGNIKSFVSSAEKKLQNIQPNFETFLPIHGFVWLSSSEWQIIDHPAFQRLGRINQLGQTNLVYRSATHQRFEHVLGSVHVAQMMIREVEYNYHKNKQSHDSGSLCILSEPITTLEQTFIRLAALLHDIGHITAGHTLEDELHLLPKHDETARIKLVLNRPNWVGYTPDDGPTLGKLIDDLFNDTIKDYKLSATDLIIQIIAKDPPGNVSIPKGFRLAVCRDIVGNTICADFLDYLYRDWHHIGKPKDFDHRIFQYMEVREQSKKDPEFVISLGEIQRLRTDAITAIINLLEYRYQLAESVLFHRTKCKAASMLERAILELYDEQPESKKKEWIDSLENRLLDHSDWSVLVDLLEMANKCEPAKRILKALVNRHLYKEISTTFYRDISPETCVM